MGGCAQNMMGGQFVALSGSTAWALELHCGCDQPVTVADGILACIKCDRINWTQGRQMIERPKTDTEIHW